MDIDKIKELMEAMEDKGMTKVALEEENGFKIELERRAEFEAAPYPQVMPAPMPVAQTPAPEQITEQKEAAKPAAPSEGEDITSPMVGTYYASPSPEDDAFVKVGDTVTEGTVVCIIEAMKVMNEVKAEKSGVVAEIYVDNAQPVEFGTKILRIK
ncbi:acetyl-CoA carboxylase biotin carboxyl carrier protein [Candidatus Neptunochlamydia vexilliferae]|uniref:acetyl-CoA carboxylase biotin carboxyl carrier protein n=1 Tax=Candidatus Neptunichlamydia vexilliferae TaxID=1651774 RepID=UPI001891496B|nr:acetyl-CoA carboxylase biotin carboxyl carrier protein [Candidatus Neptunochlamydia vexilliferae]